MIATFDSCMAQQTQRRDILAIYMDEGHAAICKILAKYWEAYGTQMGPFETLSLIEWCDQYVNDLQSFGISDVYLANGLSNLCNAYAIKIHCVINPMLLNNLKDEFKLGDAITPDSRIIGTNAPKGILDVLESQLEIVKAKKNKELTLKVLKAFSVMIRAF